MVSFNRACPAYFFSNISCVVYLTYRRFIVQLNFFYSKRFQSKLYRKLESFPNKSNCIVDQQFIIGEANKLVDDIISTLLLRFYINKREFENGIFGSKIKRRFQVIKVNSLVVVLAGSVNSDKGSFINVGQ